MTISQGEYDERGVLVVEGETQQPNQQVVMDDRFTEWSDRFGRFTFRVRYLPADCMVQLKAGQNVRPVVIANCSRTDASAGTSAAKDGTATTGLAEGDDADRAANERFSGPVSLRIIRQPCERNNECMIMCRDDEVAINAFCPDGSARLLSERSVSCPAATTYIVGYCLAPLPREGTGR